VSARRLSAAQFGSGWHRSGAARPRQGVYSSRGNFERATRNRTLVHAFSLPRLTPIDREAEEGLLPHPNRPRNPFR
jgi:hypothetical protein